MQKFTYRELTTRIAWINEDMDVPSKTEWYLMQVAYEVWKVLRNSEDVADTTLSNFKLKFMQPEVEQPKSYEEAMKQSELDEAMFFQLVSGGKLK